MGLSESFASGNILKPVATLRLQHFVKALISLGRFWLWFALRTQEKRVFRMLRKLLLSGVSAIFWGITTT